jgi:hypothetical protein
LEGFRPSRMPSTELGTSEIESLKSSTKSPDACSDLVRIALSFRQQSRRAFQDDFTNY